MAEKYPLAELKRLLRDTAEKLRDARVDATSKAFVDALDELQRLTSRFQADLGEPAYAGAKPLFEAAYQVVEKASAFSYATDDGRALTAALKNLREMLAEKKAPPKKKSAKKS